MADDLNDLAGVDIWRAVVNWRQLPRSDFDFSRQILEYTGTSPKVIEVSGDKPYKTTFLVTLRNKAQEYEFIEKYAALKGRHGSFWLMNGQNLFTLASGHGAGSTALTVIFNDFEHRGFERIYIKLKTGDILTHHVTSVDIDEMAGEMDLNLAGSLDRIVNPADIVKFSLLHLARLDVDQVEIRHEHIFAAEVNIRAVELTQEAAAL